VKIVPERYAKSYLDWLSEKRDWPVSRQLWWGHRIPVWTLTLKQTFAEKWFNKRWGKGFTDPMPPAVAQLERAFTNEGIDECEDHISIEQLNEHTLQVCARSDEADRVLARVSKEIAIRKAGGVMVSKWELVATHFDSAEQDPDVLDTWFSSALWPHSTMGWPEQTPELAYWYPTSTLITSRDIITLWVARMVIMGQNNLNEIPFREVYIHPKILDGYGESMNKSKGNGVDPLDIVDKFGADALRFGLAALTTETQDVRMPVQFECPHCQALIDQTKKNRELPKVACSKCGREFSTQWAKSDADRALPRAAVVSERFEVARNFTNKLWNAARFALINLADKGTGDGGQGTEKLTRRASEGLGELTARDLTVEDRWLLSRLATVTDGVTKSLQNYRYAEAAKELYDFAWDEFCSFYVEIAKARLADEKSKATAQQVLAHALDVLLRLLHPIMPYITEEVWQLLNKVAPERGLDGTQSVPATWLITAPWPEADMQWQDRQIESRFAVFQQALGAIREIRSRQNIPGKNSLNFAIKCDAATAALLQPMAPYFQSMANATATGFGPQVDIPPTNAKTALAGMEIYVDLAGSIDVQAELVKNEQLEQKLLGFIKAKEGKLANESFVSRAPANVVQAERDSLAQLHDQLASVRAALAALRK
jgi:valyl-tRNA synthetase